MMLVVMVVVVVVDVVVWTFLSVQGHRNLIGELKIAHF